ncbi:MAG: helix-turn-helix domain-containing protein [Cognatishimia activa]
MATVGEDLIESLGQALEFVNGEGAAIVHQPSDPKTIRKKAKLTQREMAPLVGMSLSGYRKWEQGERVISGPAAVLLKVLDKEPEAFKRAVAS